MEGNTFVRESAHIASPAISGLDELNEGVNIGSASSASCYDCVCDHGNWILVISE